MIPTSKTPPEIIAPTIAMWEQNLADTQAQIQSGKFPQYDVNCRRYIRECRRNIRLLKALIRDHSPP